MEILIASENVKKRAELEALFADLGIRVLVPGDVGGLPEVDEDQETFEGNAKKKACSGARASSRWCLGDDSGLEVDALNGRPGVYSARYGGPFDPALTQSERDALNNAKLLEELREVPTPERSARFRCALALARPDGEVALCVQGQVAGRILGAPRGAEGFGYDPLFLFDDGQTFAELSGPEKATISHRGRALQELASQLSELQRETT